MSLTWAVIWGLSDITAYLLQTAGTGLDYGEFDVLIMLENAIGGAIAGAVAGLLLQIPYAGASTNGIGLILLTLVAWIGSDIVLFSFWEQIGLYSLEDYLAYTGLVGFVLGVIFSIAMQFRKPGWSVIKVPAGALTITIASVLGRYAQIMLVDL